MVARKLDSVSEIGGELDSFADLVTFGVAPSILAYSASLKDLQSIGMICALAYSICGMLRLARFNTQQSKLPTFIGMPIPFSGNVSPHFMFLRIQFPWRLVHAYSLI